MTIDKYDIQRCGLKGDCKKQQAEIERLRDRIVNLVDNAEINRKAYEGLYRDYVKRGERLQWILDNGATAYGELIHSLPKWPSDDQKLAAIDAAIGLKQRLRSAHE